MTILTIVGSPSKRSRSSTLLRHAASRLSARGFAIDEIGLHDVPAEDLITGNYTGAAAVALRERVSRAQAVLVSSPVYKASFSGGLKALFDILDEKAFDGKLILPIATGGSPAHLLALEYGLKPVLSALGARHILAGVYATDRQVTFDDAGTVHIEDDIRQRLEESVDRLAELVSPPVRVRDTSPGYDIGRLILDARVSF